MSHLATRRAPRRARLAASDARRLQPALKLSHATQRQPVPCNGPDVVVVVAVVRCALNFNAKLYGAHSREQSLTGCQWNTLQASPASSPPNHWLPFGAFGLVGRSGAARPLRKARAAILSTSKLTLARRAQMKAVSYVRRLRACVRASDAMHAADESGLRWIGLDPLVAFAAALSKRDAAPAPPPPPGHWNAHTFALSSANARKCFNFSAATDERAERRRRTRREDDYRPLLGSARLGSLGRQLIEAVWRAARSAGAQKERAPSNLWPASQRSGASAAVIINAPNSSHTCS